MARHLPLLLPVILLAACSAKSGDGQASPSGEASAPASASTAPATVSCALNGTREFKDECQLERSAGEGRSYIVLRHPDGGFRRIEELEAGKRYKSLDGADEVVVEANEADLELTIGDDHYLFPGPSPAPNPSNAPKN